MDLCNKEDLKQVFKENDIESVIAFAGYKAVGESVEKPLEYYSNNLVSIINTLELMKEYNVKNIVFSSSATVYGNPITPEVKEDYSMSFTNPYGATKYMIEIILQDIAKANKDMGIILLRYFNPVGAHESGLIGEDPNGIPNNLMPYVLKVATGELEEVAIFGNDYDTADGTGVRDYIHVVDLAKGHIAAIKKLRQEPGINVYNLGTGKGTSVLEIIDTFEKVTNLEVKKRIAPRRSGDIAAIYTDVTAAKEGLNWEAKLSVEDMCNSMYNFYLNNINNDDMNNYF